MQYDMRNYIHIWIRKRKSFLNLSKKQKIKEIKSYDTVDPNIKKMIRKKFYLPNDNGSGKVGSVGINKNSKTNGNSADLQQEPIRTGSRCLSLHPFCAIWTMIFHLQTATLAIITTYFFNCMLGLYQYVNLIIKKKKTIFCVLVWTKIIHHALLWNILYI